MAVQFQGNGGVIAEVDGTSYRALRVQGRPLDVGSLGHYRLSMASGTIGAALAANGELFQFRWSDATRLAVIQKILVSAGAIAAATAAGAVTIEATIARAFTASGSGGATATITGNNQKNRTSFGTTLLGEARMATTVALGAGTKTLDSQGIGNVTIGIGTAAITSAIAMPLISKIDLLEVDADLTQHPIVLAQNEGIIVKNGATAWPATMTWALGVTIVWAEVAAY
jgi:hypothetical protein